jgi:DNA mismatch repair ATPase MutS
LASKDKVVKETPLMKQYKKESILMLVFISCRRFYETFGEDAVVLQKY